VTEAATEYRIEPFHPRHAEAVATLQRGLWSPRLNLCRAYLQWKYFENPYADAPLIRLAFHRDELVAMRGMYASRWEWGTAGVALTLPVAGDSMIRPDHRSRGLFRRLTEALLSDAAAVGYPAALNLSASPPTSLRSLRSGWTSVGPMPMWRRGGWRRAGGLVSALRPRRGTGVAEALDPEALAESRRRRGVTGIRHACDAEFLAWRVRNPLFEYQAVRSIGEGLGQLLLQRVPGSSRRTIVLWEADSEAGDRALLKGALRRAGTDSVGALVGPLTRDRTDLLAAYGFRFEDRSGGSRRFEPALLAIRIPENDLPQGFEPFESENWDLQLLGSDAF
jgi:GNAT superfamily N-acetyltransferase